MAIDSDNPVSLPTPPPPRPAARQEAIAAAMRKFDGEEASPIRPARRPAWGGLDRRAIGALATAAIVAVVSVPVAVITLRDLPQPQAEAPQTADVEQPTAVAPEAADSVDRNEPPEAPTDVAEAANEAPAPAVPSAAKPVEARSNQMALTETEQKAAAASAPPSVVAAAPPPPAPPPPPPPPPAPERTEQYAADSATTQEIAVTGSRIRRQSLENAAPLAAVDTYGDFLARLQSGLRADNRRAVSGLVGFPLTVRMDGRTQTYRSRREVERDFDEIFTARVKSDVLSRRPYSLSTRDDGRTRGSSRLWFAPTCFNAECSPPGPVRIREVNP